MNGMSKGPWALQVAPGDSAGAVKVTCANGGVVALMKAASGRKIANGRAVAEAPAMVEALRRVLQWIDAGCDPSRKSLQNARAILSRIDGAGEALPDAPAPDLAEAAQGDTCTGCGRESFACSLQPCPDVIADREA